MSVETRPAQTSAAVCLRDIAARKTQRRVFLLEDDPLIAVEVEAALKDNGWNVTHRASTVEEGMRIARRALFDVAIIDVNLRGKESDAVANMLSKRMIPLILCTGYSTEALRQRLPDLPILEKPFSREELCAALERTCARPQNGA